MRTWDVIVIGAGAAGLMAAGKAAEEGASALVLEKNPRPGVKVGITGKGRCNVTNIADVKTFMDHVVSNGRFLYSSFHSFSNLDVMEFFEKMGVPVKEERGGRIFPVSDRASDIVAALARYGAEAGARLHLREEVNAVEPEEGYWSVITGQGAYRGKAVVIATGGRSYPRTGSTGDGYRWAETLGHGVTPRRPGLVPLVCRESWIRKLQGLSLRNTAVWVTERGGKVVCRDFGELLFTHFGISGPVVLSASSYMQRWLAQNGLDFGEAGFVFHMDLKPGLDEDALDKRLLRDFEKFALRDFQNALDDLLPQTLIPVILERSGIPAGTKVNAITREQRSALRNLLKDFTVTVHQSRGMEEAIITMGGVDVREINPKTMESKRCPGLFFAGEVLDVDALTGGFNLQIAFSTGVAAGVYAADRRFQ